ncbi:phage major capsid protein [Rhodococcus opacus]|uniref:Phage capsid-like C-terminal domain-containing protein n=1 Tax=Rhodococcus opacus (strain B4) TaxID=632772 RepID=C1B988_RHOOB|nr:phage major capsid protein [Rhodococcus opacus]BAH52241.1 hypothetical protein ROP_39940 [Rhodococcus opacus B4]
MAINTTPNSPRALSPDVTYIAAADTIPDALVYQAATVAGAIEGDAPSIRVPFVKDAGTVGFVAEGDLIPDSGPDLDEILVQTGKVAAFASISNEMRNNGSATSSLLSNGLAIAVQKKADAAFLSNAAANPGPTGLLQLTGISDGGMLDADLDVFTDAIATIETQGGRASQFIMHPATWAAIAKLKVTTGSAQTVVNLSSPEGAPIRSLGGVPVIVTPQAPTTAILGVDRTTIIAAASRLALAISDQPLFQSDSTAIRVTWRTGWNVLDPKRIVKITVTP